MRMMDVLKQLESGELNEERANYLLSLPPSELARQKGKRKSKLVRLLTEWQAIQTADGESAEMPADLAAACRALAAGRVPALVRDTIEKPARCIDGRMGVKVKAPSPPKPEERMYPTGRQRRRTSRMPDRVSRKSRRRRLHSRPLQAPAATCARTPAETTLAALPTHPLLAPYRPTFAVMSTRMLRGVHFRGLMTLVRRGEMTFGEMNNMLD